MDEHRTSLEIAYDDRISRLKSALRMDMPAQMAIDADVELSAKMDALREHYRKSIEALERIDVGLTSDGNPLPRAAMRLIAREARITIMEAA